MSNCPTPEEEKEKFTMINPGIEKEISNRKFDSDEADGHPIYHSLRFCRFGEGFDCFTISNLRSIDVIFCPESLFGEFLHCEG
jgi:hypothetical protein